MRWSWVYTWLGEEPPSCLFTKRHKPASISPEHLAAQSTIRRNAMRCSRGVVEPNDLAGLESETAAEVSAGFMLGPYRTEGEVSAALGASIGHSRHVSS